MSLHNWGTRISADTTYHDMRALVIENEQIRVTVLLDKGTDIVEYLHKPTDTDFMWKSPIGWKSNKNFLTTTQNNISNFMDFFGGGWQECFPSGGPITSYAGGEIGLHGEVCLVPWECVITKDTPEEVEAVCTVKTYRTPFQVKKTFRLKKGSAVLEIHEAITNLSEEDLPYMWGHHPAIGEAIIDEHCRVDVPVEDVFTQAVVQDPKMSQFLPEVSGKWPMLENRDGKMIDNSIVPPKSAKTHDVVFMKGLKEGWFAVTNTERKLGFGMVWDVEQFPYIWFWQVYGGGAGYPWYGRTYNLALEPWSSYPNGGLDEAIKNGTAKTIRGNETIETTLRVVIYEDKEKVDRIAPDGTVE